MARAHWNYRLPNGNRGDTIVEVIIAIAVVSLVLVGSFTTVNRSSVAVRDSEEHAEALALLQGQVEAVRALGTDENWAVYKTPIPFFCIDTTAGTVVPFPRVVTLPSLASDIANQFANYETPCNASKTPHLSDLYNIMVYYQGSDTFEFLARWNRLGGGGDEVSLFYRTHSAAEITPPPPPPHPLHHYISCYDPAGIQGEDYYFNFYGQGRDWHVAWYFSGVRLPHPISSNPFSINVNVPPGTYHYWAFSKDDSLNPWAFNQSLHYNLYKTPSGNGPTVGVTKNTPYPLHISRDGYVTNYTEGDFTLSTTARSIQVEHDGKKGLNGSGNPVTDDSVDGGCLALHKTG